MVKQSHINSTVRLNNCAVRTTSPNNCNGFAILFALFVITLYSATNNASACCTEISSAY